MLTAIFAQAEPATAEQLTRDSAILWAVPNGVAILAVATALVLLVSWRTKAVDQLAEHTNSAQCAPTGGHAVSSS